MNTGMDHLYTMAELAEEIYDTWRTGHRLDRMTGGNESSTHATEQIQAMLVKYHDKKSQGWLGRFIDLWDANGNRPDTQDILSETYQKWCEDNGYRKDMDAGELLLELDND